MPPKKIDNPEGWNFTFTEAAFLSLFLVAILSTLGPLLARLLSQGELTFFGYRLANILDFLRRHLFFLKVLSLLVSVSAAVGTIYYTKKGDAIWREEKAKVYPANYDFESRTVPPESAPNPMLSRWQQIVANSESTEPSLWRLAIIEADIILDELVQTLHLPGETLGEKLKAVERSDFLTIDNAWEAHKARNQIAHEGSKFLLNQRETRRIISLFESVFREFYLI